MSKVPSWNNDGSDEESREAARESARRAEKNPHDRPEEAPLGERRPKSARNPDELDEADEQRLQAIARRLAEAMDRSHGGRSSSRLRHEADPDRSFEAEAIIGDAISLFKRHATDGDRSTARALESVARLIGEHRRDRSVAEDDGDAEAFGRYENELRERYAKPRPFAGAHDPDAAYGEAQLRPLAEAIAEIDFANSVRRSFKQTSMKSNFVVQRGWRRRSGLTILKSRSTPSPSRSKSF